MSRQIPENYREIIDLIEAAGFERHPSFYGAARRGELHLTVHRINGSTEVHVHDDYMPVAVLELPATTPENLMLAMVRLFLEALPDRTGMIGAPLAVA